MALINLAKLRAYYSDLLMPMPVKLRIRSWLSRRWRGF